MKTATFWTVSFYRLLRSQRIYLIICTKVVKELLEPQLSVPCLLSCSKTRGELGRNFFFTGKTTFFQKLVFSTTYYVLESWLNFSAVNVRLLVDTSRSSLRFVTLDQTRQNRPKFSLPWKDCFSFKNLCFQQPLRSQTNDPIVPTVIVKLAFGLL